MDIGLSIFSLLTSRLWQVRIPILAIVCLLLMAAGLLLVTLATDVFAAHAETLTAAPFRWRVMG